MVECLRTDSAFSSLAGGKAHHESRFAADVPIPLLRDVAESGGPVVRGLRGGFREGVNEQPTRTWSCRRSTAARLEGELAPGPWTARLSWLTLGLAVLSVAAALFACVFWLFPTPWVVTCVVLALLWVARFIAYRTTGERERERHKLKVWKEHLARLPELPDYVVVLRPADPALEPPEGGGLL